MSTRTMPAQGTAPPEIATLRRLVRRDGRSVEDAAKQIGIDPLIAHLWLRLPEDLWAPSMEAPMQAPAPPPWRPVPALASTPSLAKVITAHLPMPAYDALRQSERPLLEGACEALAAGIAQLRQSIPASGPMTWTTRPLALALRPAAYCAVLELAASHFAHDARLCAGWLIARGLGMALPLPEPAAPGERQRPRAAIVATPAPTATVANAAQPRVSRRPPVPSDDAAPDGAELARRRLALGISQRDFAYHAGLSRGLVASVEVGRRRFVLTRLTMARTLTRLGWKEPDAPQQKRRGRRA